MAEAVFFSEVSSGTVRTVSEARTTLCSAELVETHRLARWMGNCVHYKTGVFITLLDGGARLRTQKLGETALVVRVETLVAPSIVYIPPGTAYAIHFDAASRALFQYFPPLDENFPDTSLHEIPHN